jgi:hypothetical protein
VDKSVSTRQLWVCIPRGCLNKLSSQQVLKVVELSGLVKAELSKGRTYKGWTIHA